MLKQFSDVVAEGRLKYHSNACDIVNGLCQLHLLSEEKAEELNKKHFANVIDCWERLNYDVPKEFKEFKNEVLKK